ncbi:MAG: hypothetical protein J6Y47_04665 [Bacteroidales bacterium]|nr:hypothetical protein [Bacteroidales bacterium]
MKNVIIIALVVLLAMVSVLTCPDRQAHLDAIGKELNSGISQGISSVDNPETDVLLGTLNVFASNLTLGVVKQYLEVDNYFIFSIGKITCRDGSVKRLSVGVFGHVFTTFDDKDVKEWIQNL